MSSHVPPASAPDGQAGPALAPRPRASRTRRLGGRIGLVLWAVTAGALGLAVTAQLVRQVFFPEPPALPAPFSTCSDGLRALYAAIERGRDAAARSYEQEPSASDEAALRRYRDAVEPAWRYRDAVAALCRPARQGRRTLDALEHLRYSEEHGVRSQAAELASLRRRVRAIVEHSIAPLAPTAASPGESHVHGH
ncbi:MAG: hypothetical protein HY744_16310 [Deltaproteobacteria bacterium]|nr:hypothetical protein [Deltaproteobacteria bacterium]